MTKQEYKQLLIQKSLEGSFPCVDLVTQACMYREKSGKRCVAGWLIPDEDYKEDFEFNQVDCLYDKFNFNCSHYVEGLDLMDLLKIQQYHDSNTLKNSWDHEEFVEKLTQILG